jgi:SulP family sulfate permease
MRRVDAAAFLSTAIAVLVVNAVAAVAIGCAMYGAHAVYARWIAPMLLPPQSLEIAE